MRYFTPSAALDFVADQYNYITDPTRFRVVFFQGGNGKHCPGLKLNPAKPSIVRVWAKHIIKLNTSAAATHGYDAELLAQVIRERYHRAVSV